MMPQDSFPILEFLENHYDLGVLKKGEKKTLVYEFQNTGNKDLIIEIVTTCVCTEVDWPKEPIPPGESAKIVAIYDSAKKKGPGIYDEVLDVISNTEMLISEAFFKVEVVE